MNHSPFTICQKFRYCVAVIFLISTHAATAQNAFIPLSNEMEQQYQPFLNRVGNETHTSLKPFLLKDLQADTPFDSLNTPEIRDTKFSRTLVGRKLFREHLLFVEKDDYKLYLDPVLEFAAGKDQDADKNYYYNTRGVWISGSIGKRFSFNATFYENQAKFPSYLDAFVKSTRIVPGQGKVKAKGDKYDYASATGTINYQLNKHFTFQFGNDKNFIGDGYRSLLISDNAFNYPFLKIVTDVWKIRYTNIFAVMQDLSNDDQRDEEPFLKKYTSMHYLDFNIGKHASIGIFEAVVWNGDSTGNRGFDINYMNPFIFFRPVEFSIGSPDNVLLGINGKIKLNSKNLLYGQIMLDEFLLNEVKAGNGWWGNKQGLQGGFKSFNVFGIKNLYVQGEMNYVRPFTYQHRETIGNYGHYRQALAHPLGANFIEGLAIVRYKWKQLELQVKFNYMEVGYDTAGLNMGQNIFLSYNDHYQEYNNKVGQGDKHKIMWTEFRVNYLLNPVSRLSLFAEASIRKDSYVSGSTSTMIVQGGIRTWLFNRYYDF
ncbi:hypothetical protein BH11BAC2_BH11BAC2_16950 [soil metagenome]